MGTYQQPNFSITGFLALVIGPIVATSVLFVSLPLMFSIVRPAAEIKDPPTIVIKPLKVQHAPETPKRKEDLKPKDMIKQQNTKVIVKTPDIQFLDTGGIGDTIGTIPIKIMDNNPIKDTEGLIKTPQSTGPMVFNLNEVDQHPRILRQSVPQYPFLARRNNIEGKVLLKFIVDSSGDVIDPVVTEAEPEGVFDDAAIEAILKYKFSPAEKSGKPVDCIVNAPMVFQLR